MVTTTRRLLKKPNKVLHGHIYRTDLACKVTKALQSHSDGRPLLRGHPGAAVTTTTNQQAALLSRQVTEELRW